MALRTTVLAVLITAFAGAANAQDAIVTARPDIAPPTASPVSTPASQEATNKQIDDYLNRAEAAAGIAAPLPEKRAIHGEFGAAIGTGGYRSAYGIAVLPIGEAGELGIAYGQSRFSGRRGFPGGSQQNLSVSLRLDKPLISPSSPDCIKRTGVRLPSDDACGRAVEPKDE